LVADAIIRARSGIKDPRRPIGSFIFLGKTGVGKTELAKTLAVALFVSADNIIGIDMSEYQECHSVAAPRRRTARIPGYEKVASSPKLPPQALLGRAVR
jgi:ATP-dependent Clp protease ATP-binding subunit ClpB